MNQSELTSYLILLGIKKLGSKQAIPYVFSYHTTDKKYLYVNSDKLIIRTCILGISNGLSGHNTTTTEYHYPVTIEQLKDVLN